MLVDSHCHLSFSDYHDDLGEVMARAEDAGVGYMLTISTKLSDFPDVLRVAEAHGNVWCTVGVHPHEAEKEGARTEQLVTLAQHEKVVGIGETGLDYFYEHSPRESQKSAFRAHIGAARATGLPLIVHSRNAEADTVAILEEEMEKGAFTGVIHCFTGGDALAKGAVRLGFYISLSGILTFKKSDALRETARKIPLDKLLVETDAPYLAPMPYRGKRNEPAYVTETAKAAADLFGLEKRALEDQTTANFFRLFTKAKRSREA
ncbi:MAG: LuxR family transcriptional regulator [Rhodospirillaceae bacterium]|nr:MAG: LuxR family transcriptional regulator [Rhodospirillaceae bacterium]